MNKNLFYRIVFIIITLIIALGLVYFAFLETMPDLIPLLKTGDVNAIESYLDSCSDVKSIVSTILLQMVQVWSIFIAGAPIQIAAGAVFGIFRGFIICHLASVIAQFIAIVFWKRANKRMEAILPINMDSGSRFSRFLNSKAPAEYTVLLACMVPILPNGIIPLLAAKLGVGTKKYTIIVWLGTIINVLLCCAAGDKIMNGNWIAAILYIGILIALVAAMWLFRDKILNAYYTIKTQRSLIRSSNK